MENLPNELWLLIYRYLHDIDILYSFNNLNSRFNDLIKSYEYNINLSDISLKVMKWFVSKILPVYHDNIRSMIVKNNHQINFCNDNKIFQLIQNLKCLTIITNGGNNDEELIDFLCENLQNLQQLTNLHINGSFELPKIIDNINRHASPSLIHLTLLTSSRINHSRLSINLPNLKSLKIHLITVHDLFYLISNLYQLEELYISILNISAPVIVNNISFPTSLIKLHFEYGSFQSLLFRKNFGNIKNYLLQFQNQIQSFVLILTSHEREFSDLNQLELLEKSFSKLKSFQYLIHTTRYPSNQFDYIEELFDKTYLIYTKQPKRPINFAHRLRNTFHYGNLYDFNVKELIRAEVLNLTNMTSLPLNSFNIPCKLFNLHYLSYKTINLFDKKPDEANFLSKLITLSPNLKILELDVISPLDILYFFKHISYSSTTIESFIFKSSLSLDENFFIELAQIFPCLKYLYLKSNTMMNQSNSLIEISRQIQQYFKDIICIDWCINSDKNNNNKQEIFHSKDEDYYVVSNKTNFRIYF